LSSSGMAESSSLFVNDAAGALIVIEWSSLEFAWKFYLQWRRGVFLCDHCNTLKFGPFGIGLNDLILYFCAHENIGK
jgi:hypothetical protein